MPGKSSFSDVVVDGQQLSVAVKANAATLPTVDPMLQELDTAITSAQGLSTQQKVHRADRQQATKDRKAAVKQIRHVTRRLRDAVKFVYGADSEKLVEFGIVPVRPRPRVTKTGAGEKSTPTPAPTIASKPDHPEAA
jgi:hypothetical protein